MFTLPLNSMIQILVDHELDRKTSVKVLNDGSYIGPAVYLPIHLNTDNYDTGHHEYNKIFMLFTGNTSVFYANTNDYSFIRDVPAESWINTSNHDSCWRSDGFSFLSILYIEMCKKVNPNIPPIQVDASSKLSLGLSYPIKQCKVQFKSKLDYGYEIIKVSTKLDSFDNLT